MVTHGPVAAAYTDRVLFLADGEIADIPTHTSAARIATRMTALAAPAFVETAA